MFASAAILKKKLPWHKMRTQQSQSSSSSGNSLCVDENVRDKMTRVISALKHFNVEDISFVRRGGSAYIFVVDVKNGAVDGEKVALKVFDKHQSTTSHAKQRWLHEQMISNTVQTHPNIVSLQEMVEDADVAIAGLSIFADGDGFDLIDTVHTNGVPWQIMMQHAVPQLCSALQHTHKHGVLHRDVKLDNVLWRRVDTSTAI